MKTMLRWVSLLLLITVLFVSMLAVNSLALEVPKDNRLVSEFDDVAPLINESQMITEPNNVEAVADLTEGVEADVWTPLFEEDTEATGIFASGTMQFIEGNELVQNEFYLTNKEDYDAVSVAYFNTEGIQMESKSFLAADQTGDSVTVSFIIPIL